MKQDIEQKHIKGLSKGDHDSFRFLFVRYYPKVKYFISHIVKSEDVAEELSQDIFTRLWVKRKDAVKINSFNSYVYRMARNAALNHVARKYLEDAYVSVNVEEEKSYTSEDVFIAMEIESLVQIAVDKMPEQRKKIYTMSRIENLKNDEIARKLNISKKTVENHLNIALGEIRRRIVL